MIHDCKHYFGGKEILVFAADPLHHPRPDHPENLTQDGAIIEWHTCRVSIVAF